jgi:CubicO group peptidase (beta-lactamase class C family)
MDTDFYAACEDAQKVLSESASKGQILAGSFFARHANTCIEVHCGLAKDQHAAYLLGSITKPIAICGLMSLFDENAFKLDDSLGKYLPEFMTGGFRKVTLRHLLTHTSGLPDQLPNNAELRSSMAPLSAFVDACQSLTFRFEPGSNYEYSSMGILLACTVAERIASMPIAELVARRVFTPLGMDDSALGIGKLALEDRMPVQTEFGAPESGGGSTDAARWDWNSPYWRSLGAPWGGAHGSASDIAKLLRAMMNNEDDFLKASTKRLMFTNHNRMPLESRGLGFDVDMRSSKVSCTANSFGHSGSTGTLAWADLDSQIVCVVLTTLPGQALDPSKHPRHLASECIARVCRPMT